jgi:hypothetical protein
MIPRNILPVQCLQLVTCSANYQLISRQLYKLGKDGILLRCYMEQKRNSILYEAHEGIDGGHKAGKVTMCKVLHAGF